MEESADRKNLIKLGQHYVKLAERFAEFVDAVLPMGNVVPSLKFGERGETYVAFSFLGRQRQIKFEFDGQRGLITGTEFVGKDVWTKRLGAVDFDVHGALTIQGSRFDEKGKLKDDTPWRGTIADGSEAAFYFLLTAQLPTPNAS
jgi:hypothetical protein